MAFLPQSLPNSGPSVVQIFSLFGAVTYAFITSAAMMGNPCKAAIVKALVTAQAESFGVRAEVEWRQGYCVLVNHQAQTDFARQVALDLVGPERVTLNGPQLTGSEDFAFMLEKVPGSYLLIGNGDGDSAGACMVHNPAYDFNDENIATGSAYWIALVKAYFTN